MNDNHYFSIFGYIFTSMLGILIGIGIQQLISTHKIEHATIAYADIHCLQQDSFFNEISVSKTEYEVVCANQMRFKFNGFDVEKAGIPDTRAIQRLSKKLKEKEAIEKLQQDIKTLSTNDEVIAGQINYIIQYLKEQKRNGQKTF